MAKTKEAEKPEVDETVVESEEVVEKAEGLAAQYPDEVPLHVLNAISTGTYEG